MSFPLTPGLYRKPVEPVRAAGALARGDIPVFLGYAHRGPVGAAVRVQSLTQFEEIYGAALGFLWHAVKGFFETGGQALYVLRVTDDGAQVATANLPNGWQAEASFPWPMIDPKRLVGSGVAGALAWVSIFEDYQRSFGNRSADPGQWGNGLSVQITRTARARTETLPDIGGDDRSAMVASLAGLEAGSVLELSQSDGSGASLVTHVIAAALDVPGQRLTWPVPLGVLGFDVSRPVRITSVEFDITLFDRGRRLQEFRALSPSPDHSAALIATLERECRSLTLTHPDADWTDEANWPVEGTYTLSGGTDGLTDIRARDYIDALKGVAKLDEVALIAAPDLVLPDTTPPLPVPPAPKSEDCTDLSPPSDHLILGVVFYVDDAGQEVPLKGVTVDVAGEDQLLTTDPKGAFTATGVTPGIVNLRLSKQGFEPLEFLAQTTRFASAKPVSIPMTRIALPRSLEPDEVLLVQQSMTLQNLVGPYKIAIADPITSDESIAALKTWRARLGDDMRIGFFAPWLRLPSTDAQGSGGYFPCPPSGHICGAFAAGEANTGIHRAPANIPLRYVEGVTLAIDDPVQDTLNPIGINAIRAYPGRGIRINGTRSISSDPEWRYLTARRVTDAVEKTLERALKWMVFEPNNLMTRLAVRTTAETVLARMWRRGILAGAAPEAAFTVKCDEENNPEATQNVSQLIVDIAIAPTTPFEFITFRLGNTDDAKRVTETA